jgi:16S rRNA (uracil1498-N3)-methyltransferase
VAIVLDAGAPPVLDVLRSVGSLNVGVTVVIGPEGGYEPSERSALEQAGFLPASIGSNVLRFETAAIAAIAAARAAQDAGM